MGMATRFDFRCPQCLQVQEIQGSIGALPLVLCPTCGTRCVRYYGATRPEDILVNYGFRPERYREKTDRDIAHYQFEHL